MRELWFRCVIIDMSIYGVYAIQILAIDWESQLKIVVLLKNSFQSSKKLTALKLFLYKLFFTVYGALIMLIIPA